MKSFRLKNDYGSLYIEPATLKATPPNIDKVQDALLEHSDSKLLNEDGVGFEYNKKPIFFEEQDIHLEFIPNKQFESHNFAIYIRDSQVFTSKSNDGNFRLSGTINFQSSVGFTEINIKNLNLNQNVLNLKTEVYPQKLDYKDDFKSMLKEITEIIYNLAFDYFKKTYSRTSTIDTTNQTLTEWFIILKLLFDDFIKSFDLILRTPNYKIETKKETKDASLVKKVDKTIRKWLIKNKKYIKDAREYSGFTVLGKYNYCRLPESKKVISYDTIENRFIVWASKQILIKINDLRSALSGIGNVERELAELNNYRIRLLRRLNDRYLQDIGEFDHQQHFSTVLTMAPGYRDFYHRFLILRKGLALSDNDIFKLDLKNISILYEYWCFLKMIKTLRENPQYRLENNDFIKVEHNKLLVELKRGNESKIDFFKRDTGEKISIFYNRNFGVPEYSGTFNQKPDNFIEFKKEGYEKPFWYIFDAKYRFDKGNDPDYPKKGVLNGPPLDAISQLHRYRDAILQKTSKDTTYSRAIKSLGGIILFPFPHEEDKFTVDNPFYESINKVNIGALPLLPGKDNKLFKKFLDQLFDKTAEGNFDGVIDFDKTEYQTINELVIIGLIRRDNREKRLRFIENTRIYHLKFRKKYAIEERDTNVFKAKYLCAYDQANKKLIALYKIKNTNYISKEMLIKKGVDWDLSSDEYLMYEVEKEKNLDIYFSLKLLQGRVYTNKWILEYIIRNNKSMRLDSSILNISNSIALKQWIQNNIKVK